MNNNRRVTKSQNADCPVCDHRNSIDARFCNQCGAPLGPPRQEKKIPSQHRFLLRASRCPSCHYRNPVGSAFCERCGALIKHADWEVQVSGADAHEVQTVAQALMGISTKSSALAPSRKVVSVFLTANPVATSRLRLDEEIRAITEKIRLSEHRDAVELISMWATRPDDLLQALNQYHPHIVHFSGHGSPTGEIILVDNVGNHKPVTTRALKALFASLKDNIRIVVLNACYSELQAQAITEVVDCAIGMNAAIGDSAAIVFAASFYGAIGFGRSVQEAFEQGKAALLLEGIDEDKTPELIAKKGIDPSQIFLIDEMARPIDLGLITSEPLRGEVDELIQILNSRAERITRRLSRYFEYAEVQSYIDRFKTLHNQHIEALRKGNLIHAHEVLVQIYELSHELECNESWAPRENETPCFDYRDFSGTPAIEEGILICGYLTAHMREGSPGVPTLDLRHRGQRKEKPSQDAAARVYREILSHAKLEKTG